MYLKAMTRKRWEKKNYYDKSTVKVLQLLSYLVVSVVGMYLGLAISARINGQFGAQAEMYSLTDQFYSSLMEPQNLTHGMPDNELFWRASMVPTMNKYPYHRVPKVAFMFMTRGPLPLMPLWERFFQGQEKLFSVYVHVVPGYKLIASSTSPFYRRQIPSQHVSWGSVTLVDAERRLLANALLDFSNERFVLLSESCIPVYNFSTVYKYLIGAKYSFVESYDNNNGRIRYSRKMLPDIQLHQWRKGSQWFELSRTAARLMVSEVQYYPIFERYCLPICYPDEHYLPTYFNMFDGSLNSNRTVTWVRWSPLGGAHPQTYGRDNITKEFVQYIRINNGTHCQYNSEMTFICYLFARKFAPTALEPLLELASSVMEF